MVMPKLGGIELYEALKEKDPHVRVAIMTGYLQGGGGRGTRLPEGIAVLDKPVVLENLAHVVGQALGQET